MLLHTMPGKKDKRTFRIFRDLLFPSRGLARGMVSLIMESGLFKGGDPKLQNSSKYFYWRLPSLLVIMTIFGKSRDLKTKTAKTQAASNFLRWNKCQRIECIQMQKLT